jgi:membrane-associated phospholipid phosphatase
VPDLPTPPPQNVSAPGWKADLAHRLWHLLPLKIVGVSLWNWVFFIGYFHLLRNPAFSVTTMPLTPVDHAIALQPGWLAAYLTLWVYVGIAPGLMLRLREMLVYGAWAGAMCASGLALFYFWPTAVPPTGVDVSQYPGFALLQGVDAAGNACPSMHVASAAFSAPWIDRLLREARAPGWLRLVNLAWFVAIAYSTLAVKQHVFLDLLGGLALGGAFAFVSLRAGRLETRGSDRAAPAISSAP